MNTSVENVRTRTQEEYDRYEAYNLYESTWQDETTLVAEAISGPLHKLLKYNFREGELYSEQGQLMREIFNETVKYYDSYRQIDPRAEFQFQRSLYEQEEFHLMEQLAKGETQNTMVVFSTYPEELVGSTKDYLGYQHERKLGFMRLIWRNDDDTISMHTQSFDGHYKPGIEAMYQTLGAEVDWSTDPLSQRVFLELNDTEKELLRDRLLYAYDRSLHEAHGGSWFAGRSQIDEQETINFVDGQTDLVRAHVKEVLRLQKDYLSPDNQRYDFIMAMRRRYEGRSQEAISVEYEMMDAGAVGRENGETASACGLSLSGDNNSTESDLSEAGYNIPQLFEGQELIDYCMTCPSCKRQKGVKVQKIKGAIHYSCLNSLCMATTLPKPSRDPAEKSDKKVTKSVDARVGSDDQQVTKADVDKLVAEIYGMYAELNDSVGLGGRVYSIADRRSGEVLNSGYQLSNLGVVG